MDPLLVLIALALAGAIATSVVYTYETLTAPARATRLRIASTERRTATASPLMGRGTLARLVALVPLSAAAREGMRRDLLITGAPMRLEEYIFLRLGAAIAAAAAAVVGGTLIPGLPLLGAIGLGAAAAFAGWMLPALMLARTRGQRLQAVERQLPDALTVIAKSLRAGSGLLQALGYAAEETPAPLGPELRTTLRDLQLGADPEDAFEALSSRVGSPDLDIAVTAIIIQRSVGGNLSEILSNVSETIRERAKLQAEVRVLTSRQRLTGNLMAAMPVLVAVLVIGLNPDMGLLLIEHIAGRIALGIGLGFEILGLVWIRRLARIEV